MRRDIRKRALAYNIRPKCDLRDLRRDQQTPTLTLTMLRI